MQKAPLSRHPHHQRCARPSKNLWCLQAVWWGAITGSLLCCQAGHLCPDKIFFNGKNGHRLECLRKCILSVRLWIFKSQRSHNIFIWLYHGVSIGSIRSQLDWFSNVHVTHQDEIRRLSKKLVLSYSPENKN